LEIPQLTRPPENNLILPTELIDRLSNDLDDWRRSLPMPSSLFDLDISLTQSFIFAHLYALHLFYHVKHIVLRSHSGYSISVSVRDGGVWIGSPRMVEVLYPRLIHAQGRVSTLTRKGGQYALIGRRAHKTNSMGPAFTMLDRRVRGCRSAKQGFNHDGLP
jgi:hypothetical protein